MGHTSYHHCSSKYPHGARPSAGTVIIAQLNIPDSKVHGANMGPTRGPQDPSGAHVGPMNLAIWDIIGKISLARVDVELPFFDQMTSFKMADEDWEISGQLEC